MSNESVNNRSAIDRAIDELVAQKKYNVERTGQDGRVYIIENYLIIDAIERRVTIENRLYNIKPFMSKEDLKKKIRKIIDERIKKEQKRVFEQSQKKLF